MERVAAEDTWYRERSTSKIFNGSLSNFPGASSRWLSGACFILGCITPKLKQCYLVVAHKKTARGRSCDPNYTEMSPKLGLLRRWGECERRLEIAEGSREYIVILTACSIQNSRPIALLQLTYWHCCWMLQLFLGCVILLDCLFWFGNISVEN